jgi:hypothetical protein
MNDEVYWKGRGLSAHNDFLLVSISVEVNYVIFLNNCLVTYILEFRFAYHCATIKFRSSIVIDT